MAVLAEVELDHVRHERVDRLVVADAGADGVGQGDVPQPVGVHQPRDAEVAVGPEAEGVQEVVVHPPVDHVHPPQPGGAAHVDEPVVDQQVAALDQFHAHLPGQEAVLEVGAVVHARREDGDRRVVGVVRGAVLERPQQVVRVILDRPHPVGAEQVGQHPLHHLPVLQHVADARRRAAVVLQHEVGPGVVPDQVRPADVDVHVPRHVDAEHLPAEHLRPVDQLGRDHLLLEDPLAVVDVLAEQVQGRDPLGQPPLDDVPLVGRDDPRDQVEREDLLHPRPVLVDVERDPLVAERDVGHLGPADERVLPHGRQPGGGAGVVRPRGPGGVEHLVEQPVHLVRIEHASVVRSPRARVRRRAA